MSPKTVLIATRITEVRKRFVTALQEAGNVAIEVATAEDLFNKFKAPATRINLVVLDFRLQSSGVETVRTIRQIGGNVAIIIFSGSINSAAEVQVLSGLGISRYINEHCEMRHILPSLAPQLYPDNFNRRTSVRITLGIPIVLSFDDSIAAALTLNLGKGGLGLRTISSLEIGTKIKVRFRLPGSEHEIEAVGRVAWTDHRAGTGLQFVEITTRDQSSVDDFVDQHSS